jgi:hypothetical protein
VNINAASVYNCTDVLPCHDSKVTGFWFLAGAHIFYVTTGKPALWVHPASCPMGAGHKVADCETDHSPPLSSQFNTSALSNILTTAGLHIICHFTLTQNVGSVANVMRPVHYRLF